MLFQVKDQFGSETEPEDSVTLPIATTELRAEKLEELASLISEARDTGKSPLMRCASLPASHFFSYLTWVDDSLYNNVLP